ncbi:MAG: cytochrome c biogenesis protein DipZ [Xanthomonadales bacterium]|nr:cytochrome c biogenesis protein DipZ [Xanthomonadales bacterium]
MLTLILAWLGGLLTIASPCILPVLPFVLARSRQPFARSGLPMLLGLALSFTVLASLAAAGAGWIVRANQYGRLLALAGLALFGLALLFPSLAGVFSRPFVAAGNRWLPHDPSRQGGIGSAVALGIATGLLWTPCAGPILGLILTAAALNGPGVGTSLLLLTFAVGAATALAVLRLAGGAVASAARRRPALLEGLRRGLGVAALVAVMAAALGLDSGILARWSLASSGGLEQRLVGQLAPAAAPRRSSESRTGTLPDEGPMPSLAGASGWLNSPPLDAAALRGKVVLVDFWTYSCINCLRALPYVRAWTERYADHGLVVIGVHTPEFAFEKDPANVAAAVRRLGIDYPVALDADYAIWRAFGNQYWPAHYFVDARGRIRHHHFGEGDYAASEDVIRRLLAEAGRQDLPAGRAEPRPRGIGVQALFAAGTSPETYLGYARASGFADGALVRGRPNDYAPAAALAADQWTLSGRWTVQAEYAALDQAGGRIRFRFGGRDLNLVLGPGADDRPVRFRVRIDGKAPAADHGLDVDAAGAGVVREQRLYQLIRRDGDTAPATFEIEFLDAGVRAYAFTFG